MREEFEKICAFAQEKKDIIDVERSDAICNRICALLTAAAQNGEESTEMLTHRAHELAGEASDARMSAECDEDDGNFAAHILALVHEQVAGGRVAHVAVVKDEQGREFFGKFAVAS